jgi:hypothetical protein
MISPEFVALVEFVQFVEFDGLCLRRFASGRTERVRTSHTALWSRVRTAHDG